MNPWAKSLWHGVQFCADCIVLVACWSLWVALIVLLAVQLHIATSRELAVPEFVLRAIEGRFTASHVNARFGRATFDATGGLLLEKVALSLPEFTEPVATAHAVYVEIDPWLLAVGKLQAQRIHATGINIAVPALLTASGRSEDILSAADFTVTPRSSQLIVENFTARIAGVAIEAHGAFQLPPRKSAGPIEPLPLIENLAQHYVAFSRQLIRVSNELAAFEQPELHATLTPSAKYGAFAELTLSARQLQVPTAGNLLVRGLNASVRLPVLGEAAVEAPLTFLAEEIHASGGVVLQRVSANVTGLVTPARLVFVPHAAQVSAERIAARGFALASISSIFNSRAPEMWDASIDALCFGLPLAFSSQIDLKSQSGRVSPRGPLSPALLEPISAAIGHDVRQFIGFGEPLWVDLAATFGHGWKFERLFGRIAARKVDAYHVPIDAATGEIEFDGRHFLAHHAKATLGENEARGSFEQDLGSLHFRFLLEGRLRPLEISGWFGPWWPDFFQNLQFPAAVPNASVDVTGRWLAGPETTVFVFAESTSPTLRGTALDYARTLMFIRPNFFDAQEFVAVRHEGQVRGSFTRTLDLELKDWSAMTFALDSTLDLPTGIGLLGPEMASRLEPFGFVKPPHVLASGQLEGPAAPSGEHQKVEIKTTSTGDFTIFKFPARNLSFEAQLKDDDLVLDHVQAEVASGTVTGSARISGPQGQRKLGFDASVHNGRLSEAVTAITTYAAQRRGQASTEQKILPKQSQVTFDATLAAEGQFEDLFSYQGKGTAVLNGAELGEVRLLGLLSALLDFTALRFTNARLNFQLQGRKVAFPSVSITGANSSVEGHGDYWLDRGEIEFNARVYPFGESKSLLQSVVGVVLTPLSTALEVKLTGPLIQPKWAFVIGPTNFFRTLTQPSKPADETSPLAAEPAAAVVH